MANADFSREQNQTPGGFDSGSYREAKRPDTEAVRLTPLQQKLAGLEKALPTAMAKQGTALVLSVAVMLAAFVGFGGAKVRGKYNEARQWFTTGVSADNGYALSEELTTRDEYGGEHPDHRLQYSWCRQRRGAGCTDCAERFLRLPAGGAERRQKPDADLAALLSGQHDARAVSGRSGTGRCHRPAVCKVAGAGR